MNPILKALRGEPSAAVLYWERQDPNEPGPAYRIWQASGSLTHSGWSHLSGRPVKAKEILGYHLSDFFLGYDGLYLGPDSDSIYPTFEEAE